MAFAKKTWKDRIAEFPTRRRLTKEDNTSELVTVAREEGTLSQEGDAFSAENMNDLENRIDAEFTELNGKLGSLIKEGSFTATTNANGVITASDSGVYATDKIVLQAFVPSYLAYAYINESTTAYGFKIVNTVNNNPYANQRVTVTYYYIEK